MTQRTTKDGSRGGTPPAGARVVVGAGFAGSSCLQNLPSTLRRLGETLLVDREKEYVFTPLIHEVAVGRVHPDSVRTRIAPTAARLPTVSCGPRRPGWTSKRRRSLPRPDP